MQRVQQHRTPLWRHVAQEVQHVVDVENVIGMARIELVGRGVHVAPRGVREAGDAAVAHLLIARDDVERLGQRQNLLPQPLDLIRERRSRHGNYSLVVPVSRRLCGARVAPWSLARWS
ncbi:hypothetical protein D3C85_1479810 [compost metagenome]